MPKPVFSSYCEFALQAGADSVHFHYHDNEYGFPINEDNALFARMILEINQAGLSWEIILKKKAGFFAAYNQFDIDTVAAYDESDRQRLLNDAGIIRNRLKVNAAIENAKRIQMIRQQHGSFKTWLDSHHPKSKEEWTRLFKKEFKFMGGEIVNEFLMSSGYLPGAHTEDCPVYKKVLKAKPAWNMIKAAKKNAGKKQVA